MLTVSDDAFSPLEKEKYFGGLAEILISCGDYHRACLALKTSRREQHMLSSCESIESLLPLAAARQQNLRQEVALACPRAG